MSNLIRVISIVLTVNLFLPTFVQAEELIFSKRVTFKKDRVSDREQVRLMLYTSPFSIFPQFNQPATYIQTPVIQGIDPLSSMIGTFIGVAILNKMNQSEKDAAVSFNNDLKNSFSNFDINEEFITSLSHAVDKHPSFKQLNVEKVNHINELAQAGLLIKVTEPTILTISNRIYFDVQLKSVYVEANTKVWKKNEARPIYFSDISYSSDSIEGLSKDKLRQKWTENEGELLKEKIKEGINSITTLLMSELTEIQDGTKLESSKILIEMQNPNNEKKLATSLYLYLEEPNRLTGRLGSPDSSLLASLPKANIKIISDK